MDAAAGVPVIYFAPRHDDWRIQTPDGYAARVGGGGDVSSDAGASWWGGEGVGTMPHGLIAAFGGDVVEATLSFARYVKEEEPHVPIVSLVDYGNDCVGDSLAVARAMRAEFGDRVLFGVRLDTSGKLVDRALMDDPELWGKESLAGVNPHLVRKVRAALDAEGFDYVGIMVSGGFTPRKIRRFAGLELPIAAYGVGSSILGHGCEEDGVVTDFDFTADVVEVDGRPQAKVGRGRVGQSPTHQRTLGAAGAARCGGEWCLICRSRHTSTGPGPVKSGASTTATAPRRRKHGPTRMGSVIRRTTTRRSVCFSWTVRTRSVSRDSSCS